MITYFKPVHLWNGKLCYLKTEFNHNEIPIIVRVERWKVDDAQKINSVQVVHVESKVNLSVKPEDLFDEICGPTQFIIQQKDSVAYPNFCN